MNLKENTSPHSTVLTVLHSRKAKYPYGWYDRSKYSTRRLLSLAKRVGRLSIASGPRNNRRRSASSQEGRRRHRKRTLVELDESLGLWNNLKVPFTNHKGTRLRSGISMLHLASAYGSSAALPIILCVSYVVYRGW